MTTPQRLILFAMAAAIAAAFLFVPTTCNYMDGTPYGDGYRPIWHLERMHHVNPGVLGAEVVGIVFVGAILFVACKNVRS